MLLRMLLLLVSPTLVCAADLAVVRPFASRAETRKLGSSFNAWNVHTPCGEPPADPVDLFLVYSRSLREDSEAAASVAKVVAGFRRRSQSWHRCFREVHVLDANLSAEEDVYDVHGQDTNPRWVNGPNAVFRFVLRHFLGGHYSAFFLMEMDSVPKQPMWLEQFATEVMDYPPAAIRGSRYRGDKWDNFLSQLPDSLLMHINGNAIYYTSHPFLAWLSAQLHKEADTEKNRIPYDVRMAELTIAAKSGVTHVCAKAWTDLVPLGQQVYSADSLLIGNYASTMLNSSFDAGEYVLHDSLRNIFSEVEESKVTLAVLHFGNVSFSEFSESIRTIHPFRKMVVLARDQAIHDGLVEVITTPRGNTELTWRVAQQPRHMTLCELSAQVSTELFAFTDSLHMIASPVSVLMNGSTPVLPYLDRSSPHCVANRWCQLSVHQAQKLFGVELEAHYDKYSTLFVTDQVKAFCSAWNVATSQNWSQSHSTGPLHLGIGPTADDYIAWQLSKRSALDDAYMPVNKEAMGWRTWTLLNPAISLKARRLSGNVSDSDLSNISNTSSTSNASSTSGTSNISNTSNTSNASNTSNTSFCYQYIEQPNQCNAAPGCMWRPIFQSGRCIPFHEDSYSLSPAAPANSTANSSASSTTTPAPTFEPTPEPTPDPTLAPTPEPTPAPMPGPILGFVAIQFRVDGLDYAQMNEEMKGDLEDSIEVEVANTTNAQLEAEGRDVRVTREDVTAQVLPADAFIGAADDWATTSRRLQDRSRTDGVTVNVSIVLPTALQSATVESALTSSGSTLKANIVAAVSAVENITAVATGTIAIAGVILVTGSVTLAPTPTPAPVPTLTPTPMPAVACTWSGVGNGYCGQGGLEGELPLRISVWNIGSVEDAKAACCASGECGGFQYDAAFGDYVLLDRIDTPDGTDGTRRECWKKMSSENVDISTDAASSLSDRTLLLLTVLAAIVDSLM